MFGDGNGSEAKFNIGSTITVRTVSYSTGPTNTVTCLPRGFTAETNNLFFVGPCSAGGTAIVFTERLMGAVPAGSPFNSGPGVFDVVASVYGDQHHFTFRDTSNNIQDVWYDGNGGWDLQQLTGTSSTLPNEPIVSNAGVSNAGPPSAGDVSVWVYNNNQQHFTYRDTSDNIQDVWYESGTWNLQQLTGTAATCPQFGLCTANEQIRVVGAPPAAGNVFVSVYNNQQHYTYRDTNNNI